VTPLDNAGGSILAEGKAPRDADLDRSGFARRLRERQGDIEHAALTRVFAIADPAEVEDPDYVAGLRAAVAAGIAYALAALEAPAKDTVPAPIPVELLAQARYAARSGVSLDTVLRRYFAGYTLLGDFLAQAAEEGSMPPFALQRALRGAATLFDRLVTAVSQEYANEMEDRSRTTEQRRMTRIRMLLSGEPVDSYEFGYELEAWHVGVIAAGPGVVGALSDLSSSLNRQALLVRAEQGVVWAWFGGAEQLSTPDVLRLARSVLPRGALLALGEPGRGIEGWRLTHRQGRAAMAVAQHGPRQQVRYAEVGLLAAALGDGLLEGSLRSIYLAPLECERGASDLFETLRAYFAAARNVSSTAIALGVSRKTVGIRLRLVEEKVGRPLEACSAEMETALALRELDLGNLGAAGKLGTALDTAS
jgi:hypothetical protein